MAAVQQSRGRRIGVLLILCMALLMVGLDNTIVNVALPAIHRSLGASLASLQWIVDAYTLVLASLLVLSGSLGDRFGRKRILRLGLVLFTLGSALCAATPTLGVLIVARILQAIGGSMLNPVALSLIRNIFADPRERAAAIGVWGAMTGISMALGPVLGGVLVDTVGWRWVFLVNVPVGVIALLLVTLYVPHSRAERPRAIDPVGQALVIIALTAVVYAIIEGPDHGWGSSEIVALFGIAAVGAVALVAYELHHHEPLLELRFFRSVPLTGACISAVAAFAAMGGLLLVNTLYLQQTRGLSALSAGLCTLPIAAGVLVLAPVSGRITGGRGPRGPQLAAGIAMTLSPLLLVGLRPQTPLLVLLCSYLVFGIGFGLVNPPITNTAVSGMPAGQAGVAAAITSTSRQVGSTLGIAICGAIANSGGAASSVFGASFARATHPVWWLLTGLGATLLVIAILTNTRWALGTANETAQRYRASV
jgi:EmrB/QacA subfamily drug resistance transporter